MKWLLALLIAGSAHAQTLGYLGQQIVPTSASFHGVPVGGLSSIDYVPTTGHYLAISDDRSEYGPARFYELTLDLSKFSRSATPGDAGVAWVNMTTMLDADGRPFGRNMVDPESLRLDPRRHLIYWANEGQRKAGATQNPTMRRMQPDGGYAGDFPVPAYYLPIGSPSGREPGDMGVYNNLAFESVAITPDGKTLWTMTENGLAQDSPPTAVGKGSRARLLSFDLDTGRAGAEYVYDVGPVPFPPARAGSFATNGVPDMLALSATEFIVIERAYAVGAETPGRSPVTGKPTSNTIKLYRIDTRGATDVSGWPSIQGRDVVPVKRELLLDLSSLTNDDGSVLAVDNIEGLTLGPVVDGKRTLILVSDNNFNPEQFTQFIALTLD
ncbi:esterase-like activity of phytase family protein [Roseateles cellulosilyticus]|uniref:Esterase-like activity of phytase family protein n=1 Tax=Pelomonas cellulosilytica TaxID=2906762 RepID=A0ABS8XTK4_9BURK|nr:esterase-like activity of phytase family protein [Pelomonas sp. P8]MCE4556039.1 esterase-like activity of phytase family protein [Pelomonas sp. P8]